MIEQRFSNYTGPVIGSDGYSDVVYEKRDGVARLLLNRPETFNAKRGITMDEMAHALLGPREVEPGAFGPSARVASLLLGWGPAEAFSRRVARPCEPRAH